MVVIKDEIHQKKDTLMFDIDGTLVYFDTMSLLVKEALDIYGYCIDDYEKKNLAGVINLLVKSSTNKNYFTHENYVFEQRNSLGLNPDNAHLVVNIMNELTSKYIKPFPGVYDTIKSLNKDLICVSDWFKENQLNKLRKAGIEEYFRMIYTCEGNYTKSNPLRFLSILKEEQIGERRCVMIGDSIYDLEASKSGIDTILIDYNGTKEEYYDKATTVITEFCDLGKIKKLRR